MPGSAARLFDIKKAIVTAKKLDQGSMEFDLSVRDATTNEEYTDETALLPRGTRLVVQRLPAAKGHGFLSRMARNQYGGGAGPMHVSSSTTPSNFYTIDSRGHDDDEELVRSEDVVRKTDEEKELEALRAATEAASATSGGQPRTAGGFRQGGPPRGGLGVSGPPPPGGAPHHRQRPNADQLRASRTRKGIITEKTCYGYPSNIS